VSGALPAAISRSSFRYKARNECMSPSVCLRATAKARGQKGRPQPTRQPRQRRRPLQRGHGGAPALRPQIQLVASAARRPSAIRSLPWQTARRSRKSPLHARGLARTMSGSSLPGTSGLAASKSAMGSSTPRSRRGRSNAPRSDACITAAGCRRYTANAAATRQPRFSGPIPAKGEVNQGHGRPL